MRLDDDLAAFQLGCLLESDLAGLGLLQVDGAGNGVSVDAADFCVLENQAVVRSEECIVLEIDLGVFYDACSVFYCRAKLMEGLVFSLYDPTNQKPKHYRKAFFDQILSNNLHN